MKIYIWCLKLLFGIFIIIYLFYLFELFIFIWNDRFYSVVSVKNRDDYSIIQYEYNFNSFINIILFLWFDNNYS